METYRAELRNNQAGPEGDESTRSKVEMRLNSLRPEGFVVSMLFPVFYIVAHGHKRTQYLCIP